LSSAKDFYGLLKTSKVARRIDFIILQGSEKVGSFSLSAILLETESQLDELTGYIFRVAMFDACLRLPLW